MTTMVAIFLQQGLARHLEVNPWPLGLEATVPTNATPPRYLDGNLETFLEYLALDGTANCIVQYSLQTKQ